MYLKNASPIRFLIALAAIICFAGPALCDPWVEAGDVRTRHHLLVLIDHGAIDLPSNAWPLMWNDIKLQLDAIEITTLNEAEVWSYRYLKHELRKAMQPLSGYSKVYNASNRSLTPASNTEKYKSEREVAISMHSNYLAARLQGNYIQGPQDGDKNTDGSFVAASLGNWVAGVGNIDRWWGPGWHSSMSLSNNARPATSVFIQRSNSNAKLVTGLNWLGPWSLHAFASRLNEEGVLPEADFQGGRLSFKPIGNLEVGAQQTRLLSEGETGTEDIDISWSGLDWRFNFNARIFQAAVYQQFVERKDSAADEKQEGELAGIEASFNLYNMHHRIVLEMSEGDAGFTKDYQYWGREIGYMAGDGGKAESLLGFHYLQNGHQIEWLMTRATVDVWPDELEFAQVSYRFPFGDNMLISFGAMHYMEEFKLDGERIRPGNYIKLEYAF